MHMPGQIRKFVGFTEYAYLIRVLMDYRNHLERNNVSGDTIEG
jgi:hypothetical protein